MCSAPSFLAAIAWLCLTLVIPTSTSSLLADEPIRALLVIGGCCHDYARQKDLLTNGLSKRIDVRWTVAYDPDKGTKHLNPVYEDPDWAKGFDVVVHDECCSDVKDLTIIERILQPHRDGLPAVILHCGMHSYRSDGYPDAVTPWFEFTGLKSTGHGPQLPIEVRVVDADHPITHGQPDWTTINEELYNNFQGELLDTGHPLLRGKQIIRRQDGTATVEDCVVAWTNTYRNKTRVFATTLGHNNDTVADDRYLDLVTRGLLWSIDRLAEPPVPADRTIPTETQAK